MLRITPQYYPINSSSPPSFLLNRLLRIWASGGSATLGISVGGLRDAWHQPRVCLALPARSHLTDHAFSLFFASLIHHGFLFLSPLVSVCMFDSSARTCFRHAHVCDSGRKVGVTACVLCRLRSTISALHRPTSKQLTTPSTR
jgi:hypothetical protein